MAKKKTEHSKNFEKVKSYYQKYLDTNGLMGWSKAKVHNAVTHPTSNPMITAVEYEEITNEPYTQDD